MSLTSSLTVKVLPDLVGTLDLANAKNDLDYQKSVTLATGTGLGQADQIFHDQRTLAASATENLDLAGVLTDPLGTTLTFARIKALMVFALAANTNNVELTRPATNGALIFIAAGDGISIEPGACFAWATPTAAGVVVTAATADLITLTNSAGSTAVTYDVVIIGASA